MIGKTNSMNVIGGTATVDKYKGLRPSYWPKVRLPSEVSGQFIDAVLFVPLSFNPFKKEGITFTAEVNGRTSATIYWGDGTSSVPTSPWTAVSHTYTINAADYNEKAEGWLYLFKSNGWTWKLGSLSTGIQVLEISERGLESYGWSSKDIQFYSSANFIEAIFFENCNSLKLLPEFKIADKINSLDFTEANLYAFPDLNKDIDTVKMPTTYYGTEWNPNFFNHITGSISFSNFGTYPNATYLPQNITTTISGRYWTGLVNITDLSAYTYNFPTDDAMTSSPFSMNIVKSPTVNISSIYSDGKYLFDKCLNLVEATVNITAGKTSSDKYLYRAFYGCTKLVYVHMLENSVKRQIDLSSIATVYTDVEPRDNTMTVSQYAWTEILKALYNYSGETAPSYTPTITLSSTIKTFLDTLTIDEVNAKEYITNKGWTIV